MTGADAALELLVNDELQLRYRIWELEAERDAVRLVATQSVHHSYELTVTNKKLVQENRELVAQIRELMVVL